MQRYLRAEEVARLAGVAKSTILAAIRRGDLEASRTLGRGTRISFAAARSYLARRGVEVPPELQDQRESRIAVVTDRDDILGAVRAVAGERADLHGTGAYATLLWTGAAAPTLVLLDLELTSFPALDVLIALRRHAQDSSKCVLAFGGSDVLRDAAVKLGADRVAVDAVSGLRELEDLRRAVTTTA